ncbi:MAG: hypothetical protein KKA07_08700, partial [Bacteroidetes bacterium]|nr:hypothetical protein [Bacteroidota bacterium]
NEGGDYRGLLYHERYQFTATDSQGHNFTQQNKGGCFGGLGNEITLSPGENFGAWIAVNPYLLLMPEGKYNIHCTRKFGKDYNSDEMYPGIGLEKDIQIAILPFNQDSVKARINDIVYLPGFSADTLNHIFFTGKPLSWALIDISMKLKMNVSYGSNELAFYEEVIGKIPSEIIAQFYLYYEIKVSPGVPENGSDKTFNVVYLKIENQHFTDISTTPKTSKLFINDTQVTGLTTPENEIILKPGKNWQTTINVNELLVKGKKNNIRWEIDGFQILINDYMF